MTTSVFQNLANHLIARITRRAPDQIIGGRSDPYLLRWYIIPRNPLFNVYLHHFMRSDDDRALHDHPWSNVSIMLRGGYSEHTIRAGGIHVRTERGTGSVKIRPLGSMAHRIELTTGPCWTLFVTGPRYRHWGFLCPERGWVPWREFTSDEDSGQVGKGCGN